MRTYISGFKVRLPEELSPLMYSAANGHFAFRKKRRFYAGAKCKRKMKFHLRNMCHRRGMGHSKRATASIFGPSLSKGFKRVSVKQTSQKTMVGNYLPANTESPSPWIRFKTRNSSAFTTINDIRPCDMHHCGCVPYHQCCLL